MKANYTLEPNRNVDGYTSNQIECFVCKKSTFKVTRITPELVMLKCENCGEIHMIVAQPTEKTVTSLMFWDSDAEPFI